MGAALVKNAMSQIAKLGDAVNRKLSSVEVTPMSEWHRAVESRLFHYLSPDRVISGQTFNLSASLVPLVKLR